MESTTCVGLGGKMVNLPPNGGVLMAKGFEMSETMPMDEASFNTNGLAWAVSRWEDEVRYRPLVNVHRRTLDDTWRQVIRYFGGDPDKLLGPNHDMLHLRAQEERAWKPPAPADVGDTDGR